MLPCLKKRNLESPLLQESQEEDDLDLESPIQSNQPQDLGSAPLSWGPRHSGEGGLESHSMQDAEEHQGMEDAALNSSVLIPDTVAPILESTDVTISPEITLTASESSHPLNIHFGKAKLQDTGYRRGKTFAGRLGPMSQDDKDDPTGTQEPFSGDPGEKVKEDGGKPSMLLSGEELPSLPMGSHSPKPGTQLWKLEAPPDVGASLQEEPLRTPAPHTEEETEDGGLFIPTEEQDSEDSEKRRKKKKGTKRKREGRGHEEGTLSYDLKLDDVLDRTLEDGAKQHNLTAVNVRNILHVIPAWNISPIKKATEIKFQDEMGFSNMEDDGPEEEERVTEPHPNFNTPQALRFEEPLANLLNEQHRAVKELLEQLKMKKSSAKQQQEVERVRPPEEKVQQTLILDLAQRKCLQQQMQQHVQLLTQIHLLATSNPSLNSEATTTRIFLKELGTFAQSSIALHHQFNPKFQTLFQPCNLPGAMQLIEDFSTHVSIDRSPRKTGKKTASEFPCLPKQVAWILATNKVFMYPELLPVCSLKAKNPQDKILFTKAEDNLLALGLKHFEGTELPKPLISKYLLTCKTAQQLTVRIKNLNMSRAPNNIIKFYKKTKQLPILVKCCEEIQPHQWKPPIEREEHRLPFWLKASLPSIQEELRHMADGSRDTSGLMEPAKVKVEPGVENGSSEQGSLESESHYPLLLPKGVVLKLKPVANHFSRRAWRQKRSSVVKPFLTRPIIPSLQPSPSSGRVPVRFTLLEVAPSKMVVQIPQLLQPETLLQPLPAGPPLGIAGAETLTALPAVPPEARGSFPLSEPQPLLSSAPLPKVLLPSLAPSKFRKPCVKRRGARRKGAKASLCLKASPLIHTAPVIFTVPATTVKVVSLGSGCNVLQPVNAAVAQSSPPIPITTLLVNPTSFPCPLSQPLMASSIPPLIVSGNSVNLPVPSNPEEKAPVNVDPACPTGEGKITFPGLQPKPEPKEEQALLCVPILPKEEQNPAPAPAASMCHSDLSESSVYGWTVVKTETGRPALDLPTDVFPEPQHSPQGDVDIMVKVEPKEPGEEPSGALPEQDTTSFLLNAKADVAVD